MSLDRSLKSAGHLTPHRNILTRAERIERLVDKSKFDMQSGDPLHLVKVANRKVKAGGKAAAKKDAAAAVAGAPGAAAPAGAVAAAAPAAGAKGAAPAAKAAPAADKKAAKK